MAGRGRRASAQRDAAGRDVDRHVGARIRRRRVEIGLSQQRLADLVGVTYQQAHKYESGVNRISAARLFLVAKALGVGVGHFYEGLAATAPPPSPPDPRQRRLLLELARDFAAIPSRAHREALCELARVMTAGAPGRGE